MKEWLVIICEPTIVAIDFVAYLIIVAGTLETLVRSFRFLGGGREGQERRDLWLRYARWLVAALTFQLAADIIESSISTDWESIARLGAIAVIRTFLNYFLERDLDELRTRQRESASAEKA
jgi:uncharacterized membrane protein